MLGIPITEWLDHAALCAKETLNNPVNCPRQAGAETHAPGLTAISRQEIVQTFPKGTLAAVPLADPGEDAPENVDDDLSATCCY